ncbi:response regulator [Scytonema sp. UIC 10036]|uniref:response regulator n=1 Tax=Scytonema sp. UIC 10036 TaxID=2304196 RepID=UPI0012DA124A|nr:response regulator [Scytonema sp. UIC 10036]MUG97557.1 response regulator [Scytonema sp. UIC 10036]
MNLHHPVNILIIVDNLTDCHTYRRYLLQDPNCQYNVREAASGKDGLALCARMLFDAIVVDFPLPDLDSLEFFTEIERQARHLSDSAIPVILLVKSEKKAVAIQAMQLGVQDYIIKEQVNREVFLSTVSGAMLQGSRYANANFRPRNGRLNDGFFVKWSNSKKQELEISQQQAIVLGQQTSLLNDVSETILELDLETSKYKQIEDDLAQTKSILQSVIEGISDIVFVKDLQGCYVLANDATASWLNTTVEAMLGQDDTAWFPPDVAQRLMHIDRQVIHTGKSMTYEEQVPRQGMMRSLLTTKYPWRDARGNILGVTGISRDISSGKQAEEMLKQRDSEFQALADNVLHLFWTTRPDGYHEYFNQRWYEYTGLTPEQSRGWGWSHLLHPDDRQRSLEIWHQSLRTGENYTIEYRFQRASDGQYRWFLGQAFPLRDSNGQIIRWFGSCTDIHEQKCATEERDRALERERLAREQAEVVNSLKDEFLAILSHELRSPLNPILGWTQLLQNHQLSEAKTKQALASIERNAKLQTQLIDDLLDMARILRGKLALDLVRVNLVFAIEAAIETVRKAADDKSIAIETKLENIGQVLGDTARLQQIIWNLLSNAVKFTPKGGRVEIKLQHLGDFAQILVSDTGKGIPPEFLPHVFEYFRQGDASITRQYGGLGLGLAIVHHLASVHGGTVTADSPGVGQGATFTVKLPLLKNKINTIDEASQLSNNQIDLTEVRILLVDDEADSRHLIAFVLEQYGAEVMAVATAADALIALTSFKPDILISDIAMPVEDGYTLMRRVRSLPPEQGGQIPAIALTAYAREEDRQKCFAVGYQHHLSKPINSATLLAAIASLLLASKL